MRSAKEVFAAGNGWLFPDVSVKSAGKDLATIGREEMWELFAGHMELDATRVITPHVAPSRLVHFFPALHAKRPACGRRLPFEPSDSSFSRDRVTCRACLEAVRDSEAA